MYNNKDLTSMGLTHTRVWFKQLHEKLVTCTKRTPEPLQVLSVAYLMNSGVEKKPREETNPHRKPSGREGRKTNVFPCTVASSSAPLLHHRICIYDVHEVRISITMKLHGSMLSSLSSQNFH